MTSPGHGHSHSHGGDWSVWIDDKRLRTLLGSLVLGAIITVIAIILLWPSGAGRAAAIETARDLGLLSDRIDATVIDSTDQPCVVSAPGTEQTCRVLNLLLRGGPEEGSELALPEINLTFNRSVPELAAGDEVVLGFFEETNTYFYADNSRGTPLVVLAILFAIVVIAFGRFRGLLALGAMLTTVVALVFFVAPSVLDGNDPLLVSVVAASAIAFVTLYLTHGFSPTTTVALTGTLAALGLTLLLSWIFFRTGSITGLATDDALVLPFIDTDLSLSSLILGGAVIGALGALDDVTITQVVTVAELRQSNPSMGSAKLIGSGLRVGRDHIAATVNTLLLAYAGASMPLLLLFAASEQSLGSVAESEVIAVEIIRALCGSIGLVAAVPLTTVLAAAVLPPRVVGKTPTVEDVPSNDEQALDAAPNWSDFGPEPTA